MERGTLAELRLQREQRGKQQARDPRPDPDPSDPADGGPHIDAYA